MSYYGWMNYETWFLNTTLRESLKDIVSESYSSSKADLTFSKAENASHALVAQLKTVISEIVLSDLVGKDGIALGLLQHALSEVSWEQLATEWVRKIADDERQVDGYRKKID